MIASFSSVGFLGVMCACCASLQWNLFECEMSCELPSELIFGAHAKEQAYNEDEESAYDSDGVISQGDHFSLCSVHSAPLDDMLGDEEDRPYSVMPISDEQQRSENST